MKKLPCPPEESFVVRISLREQPACPGGWRGTVVHVTSGERCYISTYGELCAFLEGRRAVREGPTGPTKRG